MRQRLPPRPIRVGREIAKGGKAQAKRRGIEARLLLVLMALELLHALLGLRYRVLRCRHAPLRLAARVNRAFGPNDRRIGGFARDEGVGAFDADSPPQPFETIEGRARRLASPRQITFRLANFAEPFAQRFDLFRLLQERGVNSERSDLLGGLHVLDLLACKLLLDARSHAQRLPPLGQRLSSKGRKVGKTRQVFAQALQAIELRPDAARALTPRQIARTLVVVAVQFFAQRFGLGDRSLGAGVRLGGHDRLSETLLGVLMPIERPVKVLSRSATRPEQPVRLLREPRAQARQRRELRRGGRERLRQSSARMQQLAPPRAQRRGGQPEFCKERLARQRAEKRGEKIGGERLVLRVEQGVLEALATPDREGAAFGEANLRADF